MRIGFVSQPFDRVEPPVDGRYSIPVLTFNFARTLAARGHDVTVYATAEPARARRSREISRQLNHRMVYLSRPARLTRLMMAALRRLSRLARPELPFMTSAWFDPLYALQAAIDARSRRLDIVHLQNFSQYAGLFRLLCPRAKIVLHMHCEWLNQIDGATIRGRLRKVDRVLCTSDYIRRRAAQALPEFAARMHTLYNGVDSDRFIPAAPAESACIYFIGRVAPDKGVHLLLEAFDRVIEAVPEARLCLAGAPELLARELFDAYDDPVLRASAGRFYDGPDGAHARAWQDALARPARAQVEFLGERSHSELIERLRSAALLVQPSVIQESFGLPVAEAMAMALPVVVTRGGALPEIVEQDVTGVIVERGSAPELAAAMIALLRSPARRRAMGEAGRRRALEHFGFERLAARLEGDYAALLGPGAEVSEPGAAGRRRPRAAPRGGAAARPQA